ncbi:MAG: 30S ribosome-binding factor RbfA [Bacteroidales bacterium]|jgi:ribosome-binding factor A|nr:30S ribosome-binding factor RbfA [Bacteroidales bacterium]
MESNRLNKVARLIQKDMGDILRLEAKKLFLGSLISVTKVSVSADLSVARIYVSIFSIGKATKEDVLALIEQNKKSLRTVLAQRIKNQLRIVPDLSFFIDDSLDYAENIDKLLKQ